MAGNRRNFIRRAQDEGDEYGDESFYITVKVDPGLISDWVAIADSKLGWAMAEQLKNIMDGKSMADQNSNALKAISNEFLRNRPEPEAEQVADEIDAYLAETKRASRRTALPLPDEINNQQEPKLEPESLGSDSSMDPALGLEPTMINEQQDEDQVDLAPHIAGLVVEARKLARRGEGIETAAAKAIERIFGNAPEHIKANYWDQVVGKLAQVAPSEIGLWPSNKEPAGPQKYDQALGGPNVQPSEYGIVKSVGDLVTPTNVSPKYPGQGAASAVTGSPEVVGPSPYKQSRRRRADSVINPDTSTRDAVELEPGEVNETNPAVDAEGVSYGDPELGGDTSQDHPAAMSPAIESASRLSRRNPWVIKAIRESRIAEHIEVGDSVEFHSSYSQGESGKGTVVDVDEDLITIDMGNGKTEMIDQKRVTKVSKRNRRAQKYSTGDLVADHEGAEYVVSDVADEEFQELSGDPTLIVYNVSDPDTGESLGTISEKDIARKIASGGPIRDTFMAKVSLRDRRHMGASLDERLVRRVANIGQKPFGKGRGKIQSAITGKVAQEDEETANDAEIFEMFEEGADHTVIAQLFEMPRGEVDHLWNLWSADRKASGKAGSKASRSFVRSAGGNWYHYKEVQDRANYKAGDVFKGTDDSGKAVTITIKDVFKDPDDYYPKLYVKYRVTEDESGQWDEPTKQDLLDFDGAMNGMYGNVQKVGRRKEAQDDDESRILDSGARISGDVLDLIEEVVRDSRGKYENAVNEILDNSMGRDWFEHEYGGGNEYNLRLDLEGLAEAMNNEKSASRKRRAQIDEDDYRNWLAEGEEGRDPSRSEEENRDDYLHDKYLDMWYLLGSGPYAGYPIFVQGVEHGMLEADVQLDHTGDRRIENYRVRPSELGKELEWDEIQETGTPEGWQRLIGKTGSRRAQSQLGNQYKNYSVSHATMIDSDIVRAIKSEFGGQYPKLDSLIAEFEAAPENSEERSMILNEDIWDFMNDIAPEGTSFGSHPGDGSDFGFWEFEDEMGFEGSRRAQSQTEEQGQAIAHQVWTEIGEGKSENDYYNRFMEIADEKGLLGLGDEQALEQAFIDAISMRMNWKTGIRKAQTGRKFPDSQPAKGDMTFSHSKGHREGNRWIIKVTWDTKQTGGMSEGNIHGQIKTYIQQLGSQEEDFNWGFQGDIQIDETDMDGGEAVVSFKSSDISEAVPAQLPTHEDELASPGDGHSRSTPGRV